MQPGLWPGVLKQGLIPREKLGGIGAPKGSPTGMGESNGLEG